jgi:hypothetical protein
MQEQQDQIYDQVIAGCESHHLKNLMSIHYDSVLCQDGARRIHWMTEGNWFNIRYDDFAYRFSFGAAGAHWVRLHIHNPLDE